MVSARVNKFEDVKEDCSRYICMTLNLVALSLSLSWVVDPKDIDRLVLALSASLLSSIN